MLSLAADLIGIGSYLGPHWAQIVGMAVGLVVLVYGLIYRQAKK